MTTNPDLDIQEITPESVFWPQRLAELDHVGQAVPEHLYVAGSTELLRQMGSPASQTDATVTISGSRACTAYGQYMAGRISGDLARRHILTLSGGAFGIDAGVHQSALAVDTPTVAVLPSGLNRLNPVAHRSMLQQIVEHGGLLISAVEPDDGVSPARLAQRTWLMAALSSATVIVEASRQSKALNLAGCALRLGRALGAIPGPVTSVTSNGCHELISQGVASLIRDDRDVIALIDRHYG